MVIAINPQVLEKVLAKNKQKIRKKKYRLRTITVTKIIVSFVLRVAHSLKVYQSGRGELFYGAWGGITNKNKTSSRPFKFKGFLERRTKSVSCLTSS